MPDAEFVPSEDAEYPGRVSQLYSEKIRQLWMDTDRMFAWLMLLQLAAGVVTAFTLSPRTWIGETSHVHIHIWAAVFLGTLLSLFPIALSLLFPGEMLTRQVIAVSQMLWSGLFIHLSGGRIETHFHVFGSLAFLAFYRDWRVLATATCVVAADHFARGVFWPQSVFGVVLESPYRWMEHAAWVVFEDVVLIFGCISGTRQLEDVCRHRVGLELTNQRIESQIERRTKQLRTANSELESSQQFVESTLDALTSRVGILNDGYEVMELNANWREATDANPFASSNCQVGTSYLEFCKSVGGESAAALVEAIQQIRHREIASWSGEYQFDVDGRTTWCTVNVTQFDVGDTMNIVLSHDDISEVKNLQGQLVHAQKLEAVGQLAAGVAHEINTPIQYIGDNARFLQDSATELLDVLTSTVALVNKAAAGPVAEQEFSALQARIEAADIEYLEEEIPSAIEHSIDGANRVASIVRAMKEFSHPGQEGKSLVDLNRAVESTITVATNEWKYVADVHRNLDADLRPTLCLPSEVNQVLLNLLVNAAHAIGDVVDREAGEKGTITIATCQQDDFAEIRITDTGTGIPEHARERIFDPFFTTKEVGKGTGQGLAIAHSIIAERHGGSISFETKTGVGTTFIIRLPEREAEVQE